MAVTGEPPYSWVHGTDLGGPYKGLVYVAFTAESLNKESIHVGAVIENTSKSTSVTVALPDGVPTPLPTEYDQFITEDVETALAWEAGDLLEGPLFEGAINGPIVLGFFYSGVANEGDLEVGDWLTNDTQSLQGHVLALDIATNFILVQDDDPSHWQAGDALRHDTFTATCGICSIGFIYSVSANEASLRVGAMLRNTATDAEAEIRAAHLAGDAVLLDTLEFDDWAPLNGLECQFTGAVENVFQLFGGGRRLASQHLCEAMQALTNRALNVDPPVAIPTWKAYNIDGSVLADMGATPADNAITAAGGRRHVNTIGDFRTALELVCPHYVDSTTARVKITYMNIVSPFIESGDTLWNMTQGYTALVLECDIISFTITLADDDPAHWVFGDHIVVQAEINPFDADVNTSMLWYIWEPYAIETLLLRAVGRSAYNRVLNPDLQELNYYDSDDVEEHLKCIDLLTDLTCFYVYRPTYLWWVTGSGGQPVRHSAPADGLPGFVVDPSSYGSVCPNTEGRYLYQRDYRGYCMSFDGGVTWNIVTAAQMTALMQAAQAAPNYDSPLVMSNYWSASKELIWLGLQASGNDVVGAVILFNGTGITVLPAEEPVSFAYPAVTCVNGITYFGGTTAPAWNIRHRNIYTIGSGGGVSLFVLDAFPADSEHYWNDGNDLVDFAVHMDGDVAYHSRYTKYYLYLTQIENGVVVSRKSFVLPSAQARRSDLIIDPGDPYHIIFLLNVNGTTSYAYESFDAGTTYRRVTVAGLDQFYAVGSGKIGPLDTIIFQHFGNIAGIISWDYKGPFIPQRVEAYIP